MRTTVLVALMTSMLLSQSVLAQVEQASDAPLPKSPAEFLDTVSMPDGFELQLVASEPVITEPAGVCWNERGELFVCELHGYNLEGHYDILELNRTGVLDRIVRRIQASDEAKAKAEEDAYGVVKRLIDDDGDGTMDRAEVWADDLPPCMGIVPARGGVIVVCAPDIVFLADRDQDGRAEVRETLFTGFETGVIERRMNSPQWGLDNWIYIARGRGGRITGPYLEGAVDLPATDFRIKSDGTAIEPIMGGTGTFGFAFSESGDRFVVSTGSPAIYVAPIAWHDLARYPELTIPSLERHASLSQRTYPTSAPHPWRTRRADDPGFSKFYTDRYGAAESTPNGYFTSACSPLIYSDPSLTELTGHLLACEPAQNMVHRAGISWSGLHPRLERLAEEKESEFLASSDIWFHPIALQQSPHGEIVIVDFYREIIEDYSAIPRYLQQQYSVHHGYDYGRVWRLTNSQLDSTIPADLSLLSNRELAAQVASSLKWRRTTSRRLLIDRGAQETHRELVAIVEDPNQSAESKINALYTLEGLDALNPAVITAALESEIPSIQVHALRVAKPFLADSELTSVVSSLTNASEIKVRIQLALSLGQCTDPQVIEWLFALSASDDRDPWLEIAILSSLSGRANEFLDIWLASDREQRLKRRSIMEQLCVAIGRRADSKEVSNAIVLLGECDDDAARAACLAGIRGSLTRAESIRLTDDARTQLVSWLASEHQPTRASAQRLVVSLRAETPLQRFERIESAKRVATDTSKPINERLAALDQIAAENTLPLNDFLIAQFKNGTPRIRKYVLSALFSRAENAELIVEALEESKIIPSALTAVQRQLLTRHENDRVRNRARRLFADTRRIPATRLAVYQAALDENRDLNNGHKVFVAKCATCHRAHGEGFNVGPALDIEFRRSEETMLVDLLAPSDKIASGYTTYIVETLDGRVLSGLMVSETAGNITILGKDEEQNVVLRRDIDSLSPTEVSMMPDDLHESVTPKDAADVFAWIRRPPTNLVIFDEDPSIVDLLTEGGGTAEVLTDTAYSGRRSLRITPLQRYSVRIPGWEFNIREHPELGEYRYLRLAWRSRDSDGPLLEIANQGSWPSSSSSDFRYYAGVNTSDWAATEVSDKVPEEWSVVVRDLWKDFGDATITGIAPTAMGGEVWFDRIELLREKPED